MFDYFFVQLNFDYVFYFITNMINLRISNELKRRSFLLSNVNISSAHQAMLWTKRVPLFCQQM